MGLAERYIELVNNAGDHSGEEIPVPVPNTEVKLSCADDTALRWESRKLPAFFIIQQLLLSL